MFAGTQAVVRSRGELAAARPDRPTVYTDLRGAGAEAVLEHLERAVLFTRV